MPNYTVDQQARDRLIVGLVGANFGASYIMLTQCNLWWIGQAGTTDTLYGANFEGHRLQVPWAILQWYSLSSHSSSSSSHPYGHTHEYQSRDCVKLHAAGSVLLPRAGIGV